MLGLWLAAASALAQPYGVYREVWTGIDGGAVSDLTNNPAFPNSPGLTNVLTDYFDAPHDWADLYGTRLRAFLLPPASGNYNFWIASDDNSALFLSTDETPANKTQIAYVATWTGWREWTKEANQKSVPIYLEGGRRYYLEALQKEGGGSDNISVGWQLPSGAQELPIPATRGFPFTGVASARPSVVLQPTNLTVMDGRPAAFSVLVGDPVPVSYSWQQGGAAIPGATNSLLTLPMVFTNQTGTQFRCVISNFVGALTSALATLTVLRDTNPPTLSSVANLGFNMVRILFSKPVEPASATNLLNYSLSGGVIISNATLASDGQSVLLAVSPLPYNVTYTQTVSNVRDASTSHNTIAPNSRFVFTTSLPGIYREIFFGVTGSTVPDLTNNLNYPTNPSVAYLVTDYVDAVNVGTDYGQRYRGLLIPPATGSYVFWVASDDASTLYLSSDESPVNMVAIASVINWTSYRTWTTEANQQSAPIMLTAGRRYYLEALHKQGGGGDNFTVRWQLPDGTMEEPMLASRLNPVGLLPPQILAQPTNLTVVEGASPVFAVLAGNHDVMGYQWQKNGANIPDATNAVFTNWFVPITDNGARFRCVLTNVLAVTNSAQAVLAVTPDITPPTIVSAQNVGTTNLQIVFSERVEATTATNAANYAFSNGVPVIAAVFGPDAKTILLTTGPLVFGSNYTLVVNRVRDRSSTPNPIAPNTTVRFTATEYAALDIGGALPAGSCVPVADGLDVNGGGSDIGGTLDQFGFSYQRRSGDFDVQVRLLGVSPSDVWAKSGLMARETLAADSRFAAVFATPSLAGSFFAWRDPAGSAAATAGNQPLNYPNQWLRLSRVGNLFSAFVSYDGQFWTPLGSASIAMANTVYFGMAVTSRTTSQVSTAQFRDLASVTNGLVGSLPPLPFEPLGPSSRKTGLVISEIMYHPAPRPDGLSTEFLELFNSQPYPEDISGYRISGDVDFTFPAGTIFPGGAFLVVAHSPSDLQSVYGLANVFGPYTDNLTSKSGTVRLRNRTDAILLEVQYENQPPWPIAADGAGHSLVLARPSLGEADPQAWTVSDVIGGSPGGMDGAGPEPARAVLINEFLAHPAPPDLDFIELYNHGNQPVDLSGYLLSDDPIIGKCRIPDGTIIPARGFVSFDETRLGFGLAAGGEQIFFVNPSQTRVLDAVAFEAQALGVSSGRFPDGAPQFYPLTARTPGTKNSAILIRDVVINEIMYNPISGDDNDQYVELFNRGPSAINLGNWQFTAGISFTFPTNAVISPNGYLVVAKNAAQLLAKYPNLNAANTVGDFDGALAHSGERLALAMPELVVGTHNGHPVTNLNQVVVDEVKWRNAGRWGQWAAGGGSSLELRDPHANHRFAPNWADSDETTKAGWTNIEYTGVLDLGMDGWPADSLQITLSGASECLVDNVEVFVQGNPTNFVINSTFESGADGWFFQGTHTASSWEPNGGYQSSHSLHVRTSDRGDSGANRIRTTLLSAIPAGATATIRAKVKWLAGATEILLRFRGGWLEAFGQMPLPANLGTPGLRNTRAVANAGPAITDVTHTPAVPAANQPVVVTARVQDPDGLASVVVAYRLDPATNLTFVPMNDSGTNGDAVAGDGIFSTTVPGQAQGVLVAFHVQATDAFTPAATSFFPADAPVHECLVLFGDTMPTSTFGTYRMWMTQAIFNRWAAMEKLSNDPLDCTFVYDNFRVIYNAGAHFSGSPFHAQGFNTPTGNACNYKLMLPEDDLLLGTTDFNKLHWPGNIGGDDTMQREETSYWIASRLGLPFNYTRYMNLFINGVQRNIIMEDMQTPGGDMLDQWYPTDAGGDLYKVCVWGEFDDAAAGFGAWGANLGNYTTTGGVKKTARYRWDFAKRAWNGSWNDYTNIFNLVDALNDATTNYASHVSSLIDFDEWAGIAAVEHIVGNWDSWMNTGGQNNYIYKPDNSKWQAMIWDINITLGMAGDGPTTDLFKVGDGALGTLYNHPPFRRAYWRALWNAAYGPLDAAAVGPVVDNIYTAFQANGVAAGSPSPIKDYIAQRRAYILSQLASVSAPFAITSNGGTNFSTTNTTITLTGLAPVEIETVSVNGIAYPITWTAVNAWTLQLPASAVTNRFALQGWDLSGHPVSYATANITVTYSGPTDRPENSLIFNEIMYHPVLADSEYVELFNRSTNVTFDLSNYRVDGVDFNFAPGTTIGPRQFVVVTKSRTAFAAAYGVSIPVAGEYNGRLDPNGETLTLLKPDLLTGGYDVVNRVRYGTALPWPPGANGTGSSLQLIDAAQDNRRVCNWSGNYTPAITNAAAWRFASVTGSNVNLGRLLIQMNTLGDCYIDDLFLASGSVAGFGSNWIRHGDFEAPLLDTPAITNSYYIGTNYAGSTLSTGTAHAGTRSLHVVCAGLVGTLNQNYIYQNLSPAPTNQVCTLSFWYRPGLAGSNLTLRLQNSPNITTTVPVSGAGAPAQVYLSPGAANNVAATLPPIPPLWINELQPANYNGLADAAGHRVPWLELYNAGSYAVSLDGLFLANNYTNLTQWAFPAGQTLSPGGFKIVFADGATNESTSGELHAGFALSPGAGSVVLAWLLGQPVVLDYVDYAGVAPDHSFGSLPDGQPFARQEFAYVTPGATNNGAIPPLVVYINEWMAGNTATIQDPADGHYDDWFELYNPGTNTVSLAGYYLSNNLTNKSKFLIPAGYSIPPRGFLLVWADKETAQNSPSRPDLHVNFKLTKAGDAIGLFAPDGTLIDAITFGPQTSDISEGRFPDGGPTISSMDFPSPRLPNIGPCSQSAVFITGVVVTGPQAVTITWTAGLNCKYRVQYKDELSAPWTDLDGDVLGTGLTSSKTDTTLIGSSQRFYRVILLP